MNPQLRVANVDRDRACEILREHFAVGRLSMDDLTTRVAAAQSAVRWSDLQEIFYDLPPIPGMQLVYTGGPPPFAPPAAPPVVAPRVYPPPVMRPVSDPADGWRTAAWVCFGLGFVTFGLTWIPAGILAIAAANAGRKPASGTAYTSADFASTGYASTGYTPYAAPGAVKPGRRRANAGVIAACFGVALFLLGAVGVGAVLPARSSQTASHTLEVLISSSTRSAVAEDVEVGTSNGSDGTSDVRLPYRKPITAEEPFVTASAGKVHARGDDEAEVPVTCSIVLDGVKVEETTGLGSCSITYHQP